MVDILETRNSIIKFEICNFAGKDYLLIKVWRFISLGICLHHVQYSFVLKVNDWDYI